VKKEITNLPHSVHDRLSRIAKDNSQTFEQVFYFYALERFLYRLSNSEYASIFVLKGALMFFGWGLPLRRLTKDIDLQGYTSNDVKNLVQIIRQVCIQMVESDGMRYDPESVVGEVIIEEADYEGVRINFIGYLGKAKLNLQVDVSFADEITPAVTEFNYPTLLPNLGMDPFILRGYPFETSIAEKFQTMIDKDELNSRMKDFYDIWVMIQQFDIKGSTLVDAMINTFRARKTPIPSEAPAALTAKFADLKTSDWAGFYKKLPLPPLIPSEFELIIEDLRAFLLPPMITTSKGEIFESIWYPNKGWA
jgi:hypothetical protein